MIDLFGYVSRMTNLCERLYIITHQTTNIFTKRDQNGYWPDSKKKIVHILN